jgi:hypothetical protein
MPSALADTKIVFTPPPTAHFGAGAVGALPGSLPVPAATRW